MRKPARVLRVEAESLLVGSDGCEHMRPLAEDWPVRAPSLCTPVAQLVTPPGNLLSEIAKITITSCFSVSITRRKSTCPRWWPESPL